MTTTRSVPYFGSGAACKGQPDFETDESGDCGGGPHLIGTVYSIVAGKLLSGNGDGVLISDETAESRDNVLNSQDLLGGNVGVANVCALDSAACTGTIDATENF